MHSTSIYKQENSKTGINCGEDKSTKWSVRLFLENRVTLYMVVGLHNLKSMIQEVRATNNNKPLRPLYPWVVSYSEKRVIDKFGYGIRISKIELKPLN